MRKNQFYEAPDAELLVVRFEESLLASEFKVNQLQEGNSSWWADDEEE